jgi:hypothetical protein
MKAGTSLSRRKLDAQSIAIGAFLLQVFQFAQLFCGGFAV